MQENTQKNTQKSGGPAHSEDLALKAASSYFGSELLPWLDIKEKAVRSVPTETVKVETRHLYEDFLYEMENGSLYHFEFESDAITAADLRRFREYEATTSAAYEMPVITYVICSSRVKKLRNSITEGINTYRVNIIRLKDWDADRILEQLAGKSGNELKRDEIIPVLLTPLMNGEHTMQSRIVGSIRILRKAETAFSDQEIRRMEAILYIMATKFLNESELKKIKEEMAMTKLGQMIWDDAVKQGREEGRSIGREEGREEGQAQASERYSRLILLLNRDNRTDQIIKIASDPEYREALYKEYKI